MFWYDGKLVENNQISLEISNPGLIYGATVFTTLRVYHSSLNHPLTHWQQHCDRHKKSLIQFDWPVPDLQEIKEGSEQLSKHTPLTTGLRTRKIFIIMAYWFFHSDILKVELCRYIQYYYFPPFLSH